MKGNGLKLHPGRFSFNSMIFFMEKVVKHWNRLSREVVDHHHWKGSKPVWIWSLKTWFDGEHSGGAKLIVELDDLKCLFQT